MTNPEIPTIHTANELSLITQLYFEPYDKWDVTGFDGNATYGLIVVGHAQAGKSTLTTETARIWSEYSDDNQAYQFTNSKGFRGLTAEVLTLNDISLTDEIPREEYAEYVQRFAHGIKTAKLASVLRTCYEKPAPEKEVLRSKAVSSVVDMTSEHHILRPAVNAAGAKFLAKVLRTPKIGGLEDRPGLVILDARNNEECREKFSNAGVRTLGTIILTCPERVVAERKLGADASETAIEAERARLEGRNATDRNRQLARMTLPEDFRDVVTVDKIKSNSDLYDAGTFTPHNPNLGIVMRTDRLTVVNECHALDLMLSGMLNSANGLHVPLLYADRQ